MSARFAVEVKCTCTDRCALCTRGWHVVVARNNRGSAVYDQLFLAREHGNTYRVVDSINGQVIGEPVGKWQ